MDNKIRLLQDNTGKYAKWLPTCHSTNSYVHDLIKRDELPDGGLFYTFHQTAGRGQVGNTWEAEPNKNLTFSKVLRAPAVSPMEQFFLNIAVSVAIHSVLKALEVQACIKWPNDIFVHQNKIAGVLIENHLRAGEIKYAVIGIGLNINQTAFQTKNATSLKLETGLDYDLMQVLSALDDALEQAVSVLAHSPIDLVKTYHAHLFQRGERASYFSKLNQSTFEGIIQGIDLQGRLVMLTSEGKRTFDLKEVTFLK